MQTKPILGNHNTNVTCNNKMNPCIKFKEHNKLTQNNFDFISKENNNKKFSLDSNNINFKICSQKNNQEENFIIKETQKIKRNYLNALMVNEINKNEQIFRTEFLTKHQFSTEVRVRMVKITF